MLKKKELVVLNTKENNQAILAFLKGAEENMGLTTNRAGHFAVPSGIQVHYQPQYAHLYVLADEGSRIRRGDCYVIIEDEELHCHTTSGEPYIGARKVIATSDPNLYAFRRKLCPTCKGSGYGNTIANNCPDCNRTGIQVIRKQIPQISIGFIEKFRNKHCKGNVIKYVMVECDEYTPSISHETSTDDRTYYKLKLKNNTITIKKCKESWDEKEVKQLCWKAYTNGMPKMSANDISTQLIPKFDKWFEANINNS